MSTPFAVLTAGTLMQIRSNMRSSIESALCSIESLSPGQPHAVFYRQDDGNSWKLNLTLFLGGESYSIYVKMGTQPGEIWVQAERVGDEKKGAILINEGGNSPIVLRNEFNDLALEAIRRIS